MTIESYLSKKKRIILEDILRLIKKIPKMTNISFFLSLADYDCIRKDSIQLPKQRLLVPLEMP